MTKHCPKCNTLMDYREFVSMGPGYSEWETGGDEWLCPDCSHRQDVEYEDTLEGYKLYV